MRRMQLDADDAEAHRAQGGGDEIVLDLLQAFSVEGGRCHFAGRMGKGGGRHALPAGRIGRGDLLAAGPGFGARRLAAGMAELDGDGHLRMDGDRIENAGERRLVVIGIEPEILVGVAGFG